MTTGTTVTDSIVSPDGDRFGVKVGTTLNWFIPDLHGDVAGSWDASEATVVNAIRYDAWGQTLASGSAGGSAVGTGLWKYQGRLDVSPSGLATPLYDMSARSYSPGIGAFTSLDSVMGSAQDPLSMNRFLYAEGDPTTLVDPSGHMAMCATSDLCDESQAVRYRGTTGGREARIRSHLRDHGGYRDNGRGDAWIRRSERGRKYQVTHDPDAVHQAKLDALKGADQLAAKAEDALERFEGAKTGYDGWDLPDQADKVPDADKERVLDILRYTRYLRATGHDAAASDLQLRTLGAVPNAYVDMAGDPGTAMALAMAVGGLGHEGAGAAGGGGTWGSAPATAGRPGPALGSAPSGPQAKTSETGSPGVDVAGRRVVLRKSTKQTILDRQRAPDGKLYDPNTGLEISEGAGHFGHRPGSEWWRTKQTARREGWTRRQLIEYENDPTRYQYEDPSSNMGHQFEEPR